MDLGVFYICYKEQGAIEFSLKKFREFYPENPIYLVSDNGLDFSYLKNEFGNIETVKETIEVVGVARDVEQYVKDNSENTELFLSICMEYLRRLKNGCDFCKTEYIILMEPDVLVRGKLSPFEADLVGPTANIMPRELQEYIIMNGGKNNGTWGPVGGVMKTKSFYEVYDKMMNNLDKFIGGLKIDPRMICYDYLLAYLFSLFGYAYTDNPDQTECFRNPNWKHSGHPILHQFREFYSLNYDGKWKS
jgi:hypothetical protein